MWVTFMQTGIQLIDKAISKYGLVLEPCKNAFQQVDRCFGGSQPQYPGKTLPFCIAKAIFQSPMYSVLYLHYLTVPGKDKPLACYLVDENGRVIERVYYQNSRKYYDAFDKLIKHIEMLAHNTQSFAA
jgi:hypothetical protein